MPPVDQPTTPPPYHPQTGQTQADHPEAGDPHWALIAALAQHRSVSFAGSVPLLVDGLPADRDQATRVLERIATEDRETKRLSAEIESLREK